MPSPPLARLLVGTLTMLPGPVFAQSIQRCESAEGVSYSDAACPPGTRTTRGVTRAIQPSAEAQKEARERARREKDVAQSLAARRQPPPAPTTQSYVPDEEARRAADCAYLRGELDASHRLRNILTTRPYYSTDDVEQMDARQATLAAEYRRVCTR